MEASPENNAKWPKSKVLNYLRNNARWPKTSVPNKQRVNKQKYRKDSSQRELEIDDVIATVPGNYFPYTCLKKMM